MEKNNIQIALYSRVSSEEQKDGKTIDSQVNELKKHAQEKGYVIIKEYKDDGWSGGMLARPSLDELRDDASKGLFQAVLVNDVDRLARDVSHIGIIKRDLEKRGVQLIFRKLPNGNSPTDNLMINMLGSFAEFEREMIADRTRRGRRYKAEIKKIIVGHTPPYGFKYMKRDKDNSKDGYYEINSDEILIVKKIFELVDSKHYTARMVSKWLTDNKILPRKGNKRWSGSVVSRILRRMEYIGMAHYNKSQAVEPLKPRTEQKYRKQKKSSRKLRPKSEWLPIPVPECKIIPEERFYRVQEIIDKNRVFSKRNTKYEYLISGLTYCSCGALYAGEPQHGKPFYRCRNRINNFPLPRTCYNKSVKGTTLDNLVWGEIEKALSNPQLIIKQVEGLKDYYSKNLTTESDIKRLGSSIKGLQEQEKRILDAYKIGAITLSKYQEEVGNINRQKINSQKELAELLPDNSLTKQMVRRTAKYYCDLFKKRLSEIRNNFGERQRIVRELVKKITVGSNDLLMDCALLVVNESKVGIVSMTSRN